MELFLLFSLALTCVAFLSIVLSEPPAPLTAGSEVDYQMGFMASSTSVLPEPRSGVSLHPIEVIPESTTARIAVEELPATA